MFFPLKNFLRMKKLCGAHLFIGFYLEVVMKIEVIVIYSY